MQQPEPPLEKCIMAIEISSVAVNSILKFPLMILNGLCR